MTEYVKGYMGDGGISVVIGKEQKFGHFYFPSAMSYELNDGLLRLKDKDGILVAMFKTWDGIFSDQLDVKST